MSVDDKPSNPSGNRTFQDVLNVYASRRDVIKGGIGAAVGVMMGSAATNALALGKDSRGGVSSLLDFEPVAIADVNGVVPTISQDYTYEVLIPWGDPLTPSGPAYNYPPSAADQALQIGIGHDGMTYFPIKGTLTSPNSHGLLAINHEFGINPTVIDKVTPTSLEDVRTSQHAHGVSIVEIRNNKGTWETVESNRARRIHVNTPMAFAGPAAGHPLLDTPAGNAPAGTVNNCSNGDTPWGTYLTCEENFNGYFGYNDPNYQPTPEQDRYGFSADGFGYGWHLFDERFDLSNPDYTNEENRFGWVVEIDPQDPTSTPVKRTALGRCKHEGAAVAVGQDNRVVVYCGDDQRFDYIYKFVSDDDWKTMFRNGMHPLDHGTLYVARFNDDGTGDWLELSMNNPDLAKAFPDDATILTYTRLAADLAGATPMDRPEWATIDFRNEDVYCTLTNNSQRTEPDAANPQAPNTDGHIIRWRDADHYTGLTFTWDIFLLCSDLRGTEDTFTDPDGLWMDPDGRLFVETDGGQPDGLQDQLVIIDSNTSEIRRLLVGVSGDEITGIAYTPDRRTLFANIQHPGNGDPTATNFPVANDVPDGVTVPRDCTLVIRRKDGGIIGS